MKTVNFESSVRIGNGDGINEFEGSSEVIQDIDADDCGMENLESLVVAADDMMTSEGVGIPESACEDMNVDDLDDYHDVNIENQPSVSSVNSIEDDITGAIIKAFCMIDDMGGSQKNLMEVITFGRDLYCKQSTEAKNMWPKNYSACLQVLRRAGYKDPVKYHVCLNESHPTRWSLSLNQNDKCQYCNQPRSIPYYYLKLSEKLCRWCADEEFCYKMTAHWRDRSKWLNGASNHNNIRNEIWDGTRYACIILIKLCNVISIK